MKTYRVYLENYTEGEHETEEAARLDFIDYLKSLDDNELYDNLTVETFDEESKEWE